MQYQYGTAAWKIEEIERRRATEPRKRRVALDDPITGKTPQQTQRMPQVKKQAKARPEAAQNRSAASVRQKAAAAQVPNRTRQKAAAVQAPDRTHGKAAAAQAPDRARKKAAVGAASAGVNPIGARPVRQEPLPTIDDALVRQITANLLGETPERPSAGYSRNSGHVQTAAAHGAAAKPKKRSQADSLSFWRTVLLVLASIATVTICIFFLSMKSGLAYQKEHLSDLQTQVTQLKEENDSRFNHISDSVNLEQVRQRALDLGMNYAKEEQIIKYEAPVSDYVEQKDEIPK